MSEICLICNRTYMVQNKSRHLKSKKHLLALENKSENTSENLNYFTVHVNKLQNELQVSRGILDKLVRDLSNNDKDILVKICAGAKITTTSQSRQAPPQSSPPPPLAPLQSASPRSEISLAELLVVKNRLKNVVKKNQK